MTWEVKFSTTTSTWGISRLISTMPSGLLRSTEILSLPALQCMKIGLMEGGMHQCSPACGPSSRM